MNQNHKVEVMNQNHKVEVKQYLITGDYFECINSLFLRRLLTMVCLSLIRENVKI